MLRRATPDRVALVGMMGSGKSTIGRLLAARTGWPFYDNDALFERATGMSARDFLATHGKPELRAAEAAALRVGLAAPPPCIVAVAAGTIEDATLRELVREHATVVWLVADPHTLTERATGATHRPWLGDAAEQWVADTANHRAALYEQAADITVHTDAMTPADAAALIAERLSLPLAQ